MSENNVSSYIILNKSVCKFHIVKSSLGDIDPINKYFGAMGPNNSYLNFRSIKSLQIFKIEKVY